MKPNITVTDQCKIKIASFESEGIGRVSQKTLDMTAYTGQHVRVWLEDNGTYSVNKPGDHYWQVAEFDVPVRQYVEAETLENEEEPRMEEGPVDLTGVSIMVFDLPGTPDPGQPEQVIL